MWGYKRLLSLRLSTQSSTLKTFGYLTDNLILRILVLCEIQPWHIIFIIVLMRSFQLNPRRITLQCCVNKLHHEHRHSETIPYDTEYRWRSCVWHRSQQRTGLANAGSGMTLSEQALQKIPPQLRQWCWGTRTQNVIIIHIVHQKIMHVAKNRWWQSVSTLAEAFLKAY